MTTIASSQAVESKGLAKYKQELDTVRENTFSLGVRGSHNIDAVMSVIKNVIKNNSYNNNNKTTTPMILSCQSKACFGGGPTFHVQINCKLEPVSASFIEAQQKSQSKATKAVN